jgi:NADP-dependent 3-hydroxy acid dehydrogenase YdfG
MKTVFITGTSAGIGRETAKLFQSKGWNVIAGMRKPQAERELVKLENVKVLQCDVTDQNSIKTAVVEGLKAFGSIDVLVNNAGVYTTKPLEMNTEDDINSIINTNIIGTMHMIQAVLPHFRCQKAGMIINISSVAGKLAFPFQSLYHTSKWAIEGMSEGLQYELQNLNIKVKVVEPGMVKTKLYDEIQAMSVEDYPNDYIKSFKNWHAYLIANYNKGYGPDVPAKTIYQAATDQNSKLCYASGLDTKMVFLLKKLLPFAMFKLLVRKLSRI